MKHLSYQQSIFHVSEEKKDSSSSGKKIGEAPSFIELLQGQNVIDGDSVTLQCRVSGINFNNLLYIILTSCPSLLIKGIIHQNN